MQLSLTRFKCATLRLAVRQLLAVAVLTKLRVVRHVRRTMLPVRALGCREVRCGTTCCAMAASAMWPRRTAAQLQWQRLHAVLLMAVRLVLLVLLVVLHARLRQPRLPAAMVLPAPFASRLQRRHTVGGCPGLLPRLMHGWICVLAVHAARVTHIAPHKISGRGSDGLEQRRVRVCIAYEMRKLRENGSLVLAMACDRSLAMMLTAAAHARAGCRRRPQPAGLATPAPGPACESSPVCCLQTPQ